ncbi:MAG: O-antigen ligase family protein [Endomicrobium sp.]|nr:O-antigen ligase family protein [Endomicrobium sp.]
MYLLIGFLKPEERTKVLIIPVLIGLLLTIYIFVSLIPFPLSKVFSNKDTTGYMSCVTCFLLSTLSLSFAFWNEKKRIYICISFIFFIAILMVSSLFAVCIASFIFSVALLILGNKRKKIFSAVFALSGILSFYFLLKSSFFSEKFLIWKTALSVITDNFLLGVGFNNYKSVSLSYGTVENVDVLYCYNIFLQVLAETGIIGFVLFLTLLFVFFFFVIKRLNFGKDKKTYLFVLFAIIVFLVYNFFNSTAFVSTNMLMFFYLLSFPLPLYAVEKRRERVNGYILAALSLFLIISLGIPLCARQEYKKGISFFANKNFAQAKICFIKATGYDYLNPEYSVRLSDVYFAMYQVNENKSFLKKALKWSEYASGLAKNNGKYYYQLAWLYHFVKNDEKASENIVLAVEKDPFNLLYQEAYQILLM